MGYFLAVSCVVSGWVMLRLIGGARMVMLRELEKELKKAPPVVVLPSGGEADKAKAKKAAASGGVADGNTAGAAVKAAAGGNAKH
jgi:hypothetical protein